MNKLYKLMNWPEIEGIVYSDSDNPHHLLGPHKDGKNIIFQAFFPNAVSVNILLREENRILPMEQVDEAGYFAAMMSAKTVAGYQYEVTYPDGVKKIVEDAYSFAPQINAIDTDKYNAGIHYTIYEKLGAHPMTVDGVQGCEFAVWAPNAQRVSVVGDFNNWDGRIHQMRRLWDSGIFEIFVPGVKLGDRYKFELKVKSGLTYLKADPFALQQELPPRTASIVCDLDAFSWHDSDWLKKRKENQDQNKPISIYEVHLGSFVECDLDDKTDSRGKLPTYEEIADKLIPYVKEMGYTHIELMPVMEHPLDVTLGYQTIGYYAPTSRYGSPEDFMNFMDQMHRAGIGVILDWAPEHFPKDDYGLGKFDGTCLYEHLDPRKGENPKDNTLLYNYGRNEVKNYLIANALFWVEKYHADGIRISGVSQMLYLDYDRSDGDWIPNMYGGNENLEAIEFMKHLNSMMKKRNPGVFMIAQENTGWPRVTGDLKEEGLGFDLKWNTGWMQDYIDYIKYDPYFRSYHHDELTLSMIYAYSEHFILPFPHDEVMYGKGSLLQKMPGEPEEKLAGLRMSLAYLFMHPGKKHLFMGQDMGDPQEWWEGKCMDWQLLEQPEHIGIRKMVADLNHFYKEHPALYQADDRPEGFSWVDSIDAEGCKLTFIRSTFQDKEPAKKQAKKQDIKTDNKDNKEELLVVCNFAGVDHDEIIGVPYAGKYKEIFNSDHTMYGGQGMLNIRVRKTMAKKADGYAQGIKIKMPARSVSVFRIDKEQV
ncbi:MAG: 1,4-alpha-glucan branching protein GlgB [Lachnospiraceae bacterium]